MKRSKKAKLKRMELATVVLFLAWLAASIALWKTRWMEDYHVLTGLSLVFAAVLYVLLGIIRRLPQLRMTNPRLAPAQAMQVVRLRVFWLAVLRLVFMAGFAGMSLALLFSEALRVVWAVLFMLAFAASFVWYFVAYRKILLHRPAGQAQEPK